MAIPNPAKNIMIAVSNAPEIEYHPIPLRCEYCGIVAFHPGGLCPSCGAASPANLPSGVIVVSNLTGFSGVLPSSLTPADLQSMIEAKYANSRFMYGI